LVGAAKASAADALMVSGIFIDFLFLEVLWFFLLIALKLHIRKQLHLDINALANHALRTS
jgi:hypothetical protein